MRKLYQKYSRILEMLSIILNKKDFYGVFSTKT